MRKSDFTKHLRKHGCQLKREGAKHEIWENSANGTWSSVPRHNELKKFLCIKICKDLGIVSQF
ncbi:MAG TPA: type II toxin-antitoxin system HicA family toxin [Bacteroidia bacterium]|nr:type II toxin-antitoxin system HicA family toxin [Bacteroidia bacterium]